MPLADVVILSAARTPIGRYGGSFRDVHPAELGAVAARAAIERAGLTPDAIDEVFELNEAFAAQVLAVLRDVPISSDRLNVNGGAIALGHPIGCTGARIVVTLLHELERRAATRGLATLCVSGGMGMALAIERCE
jgi:acetyl-CoA C-acetyltransferase